MVVPVLAALAVAGCGASTSSSTQSSSSASSTGKTAAKSSPAVSLAHAADVSASAAGFTMTMAMDESLGAEGHLTMTGAGSFSTAQRAGEMSLAMKVPGTSLPVGNLKMKMILLGDQFYMQLPSSLSAVVPGGKTWMAMSFRDLGNASKLPGLGSLLNSEGSFSDPGQYLNYLRATAANGIQDLGTETVDGVQTTHYRAQIDLAHLTSAVPASERAAAAKLVAEVEHKVHLGMFPMDAWIDSSNRVRRIEFDESMSTPVSGKTQSVSLTMTENFTSYGPQPVPSAPPADQTMDLATLLHGA